MFKTNKTQKKASMAHQENADKVVKAILAPVKRSNDPEQMGKDAADRAMVAIRHITNLHGMTAGKIGMEKNRAQ